MEKQTLVRIFTQVKDMMDINTSKITFQNYAELENFVVDKPLVLSQRIVKLIKENLDTKEEIIDIIEFKVTEGLDDGETDTIMVQIQRDEFEKALQENLKNYIYHENYEECTELQGIINSLNRS